jgi:serine/threonine-protein kinase RIO1
MDSVIAKRMEKELLGHEVGGWTIVGHINSGRSAVVFRAKREGETAAIKIFDPELVERLEIPADAKAASRAAAAPLLPKTLQR